MNKNYINRLAESELKRKLKSSGCVLVSGPKFCGKTEMCKQFSNSSIELNTLNTIELIEADVRSSLVGEVPHLIDEWQKVPDIWNAIKEDLDKDYVFGKYILTGSTTPPNSKKIQHSGAGRITKITLKPFSLFESGESTGIISLKSLFKDPEHKIPTIFENQNKIQLSDIAYYICRGGWPISVLSDKKSALEVTKNYFDGLFAVENESDEFAYYLKNIDKELLILILKSFARNISTQCKKTTMINDILDSGHRSTLDEDTFTKYSKILKDLFIIYDMPARNLNLRSSVSIRKAPTHHFIDTSIATASLNILPSDLLKDMKSFGLFFEDFAVRDLSIYSQSNGYRMTHYRDSSGQEIDSIIETSSGDFAAVEIKIASEKNINEGISSLNSFKKKLLNSNLKPPAFSLILTSHGACYKTKDGIFVVPINFLKN